ncbi:DedA family protein [Pseudonocardia endophytica]|uniref:Membrane protein DedA with SNARE-associated domain n=1 Tax=Pseudonocardia endophytica TaxID=401976 RepID=A0A4R1HJH6_PSEEN|nr:VTT domain-containing protein [Pseudonocardia endophytica]TCK22514.1 membrane protein DedA with SNARE-associated domain [Pseudonocardia endophytica]
MDDATTGDREAAAPAGPRAATGTWRDALPWDGPARRGDTVLLWLIVGVIVFAIATLPLRPLLLASHPVLVEFVTGGLSAIGAGAAFARIGETSLWLVVLAGVVGMAKFDWLFWLAGRRWGERVVAMFAPGERAQRFVARVRAWPPWVLRAVLVGAALPGMPAGALFALAGLSRVGIATFLLFDLLGALLMTGIVAGLGYGMGQSAVDVVLVIDSYASWISIGLIAVVAFLANRRARRRLVTPA